jgi:L-rhamnose isomerase
MNENWQAKTRPILEAFWHCSYFLRMLERFGRELDEPPMPARWTRDGLCPPTSPVHQRSNRLAPRNRLYFFAAQRLR